MRTPSNLNIEEKQIHERLEVIMTGGLRAKGNGVSGRPLNSTRSKNDRRYHT